MTADDAPSWQPTNEPPSEHEPEDRGERDLAANLAEIDRYFERSAVLVRRGRDEYDRDVLLQEAAAHHARREHPPSA